MKISDLFNRFKIHGHLVAPILVVIAASALMAGAEESSHAFVQKLMTRSDKKIPTNPVVMGYVTSWSHDIPDPSKVTHLAYAFATVDSNFQTVSIEKPERLKVIADLKKKKPDLKILLSVGGAGAGNFSEMAADKKLRKAFANNLLKIVKEYNLDGIDMDWEVPGKSWGGISSSKDDRKNFTLLMSDIRKCIGKNRMLTFAIPSWGDYYELKKVLPKVDFVSIMAYDMGQPPKQHHSPLYHTPDKAHYSLEEVVEYYYKLGIPIEKMVIGVPFYGRGDKETYSDFIDYRSIKPKGNAVLRFDREAMAPFMEDSITGKFLLSFDNPESMNAKAKFIRNLGTRGIMFWHYCGDKSSGELIDVIDKHFLNQ